MRNADTAVQAYTWLSCSAAAVQMGVSAGQVRRWIASGRLEAMDVAENPDRPGHRPTWRIAPASVAAEIRRRTRNAKVAA